MASKFIQIREMLYYLSKDVYDAEIAVIFDETYYAEENGNMVKKGDLIAHKVVLGTSLTNSAAQSLLAAKQQELFDLLVATAKVWCSQHKLADVFDELAKDFSKRDNKE